MASNIQRTGALLQQCTQVPFRVGLHARWSSSLSGLRDEMTSRRLPILYDNLTFGQSYLLENTLSDFLPPYPKDVGIPSPIQWARASPQPLRPSYHLIYFPTLSKLSQLLPDNTETDQSPGGPFVRRMWAGGRIEFLPAGTSPARIGTGQVAACMERISDVKIKGSEGDEKVFVTIERRVKDDTSGLTENEIREVLLQDETCGAIEHRNIVFMRERTPEQVSAAAAAPSRIVKSPHAYTFSHSFTPTASLLFRFSALTWNAHSIHLDKMFCRAVEGHRNLLFHGPLSLVMMVELLQRHLASKGTTEVGGHNLPARTISEIEYRNLAPLYAEEKLSVCGREKENGAFELWIENKDGGMCVKATAQTANLAN